MCIRQFFDEEEGLFNQQNRTNNHRFNNMSHFSSFFNNMDMFHNFPNDNENYWHHPQNYNTQNFQSQTQNRL